MLKTNRDGAKLVLVKKLKLNRIFILVFSLAFIIFTLFIKIFLARSEDSKSVTKIIERDPEKGIGCSFDKDKDGKIELSLAQEDNESEIDCLLMGCNIYEFD